MESGEGMVAVVRGLQGSGLAVTLLESGRQFTLLPENFTQQAAGTNVNHTTASQCAASVARRDSGVQATDGRYTSTYKMMHCHSTPTSPPELVTEFPPQRADMYPGHGNFIVGGQGSGESYYPAKSNEFRGAMCWPDRGSVCSPRPSLQPDSFASSLRKYPISQDRSSEIVERLINFTQAKNSYKNNRNVTSPRNDDVNMSNQTFNVDATHRNNSADKWMRGYQPDVTVRPKRFEESRGMFKHDPYEVGAMETWRSDVRYLRGVSRKVREDIRSLSAQADNRPERLNPRERSNPSNECRKGSHQWSTDTVNMEIQAAVQMITREMMTSPRVVPSLRTVAVPLTPTPSNTKDELDKEDLNALNYRGEQPLNQRATIVETKLSFVDMNVQTFASNVEFSFPKKHKRRFRRHSRSVEKIQIIELMKYRNPGVFKQNCLKSRSNRKLYHKSKQSEVFVDFLKKFDNQIFNVDTIIPGKRECASDKYRQSFARIINSGAADSKTCNEDDLNKIIESWMKLIPLKLKDEYDLEKQKKKIQYEFFNYLKRIANVSPERIRKEKLKADILERLKLIHIDVKSNKVATLNKLAEILINRVTRGARRRWEVDGNRKRRYEEQDYYRSLLRSHKSPTEKDVEDFVSKYTVLFLQRFGLMLHKSLIKDIEDELLDIFIISLDAIADGDNEIVKRDITQFLHDYGLSEQKAYTFAKALIKCFEYTLIKDKNNHTVEPQTLTVLPNLCCNNKVADDPDFTMKSTTDEDILINLTHYTNNLRQEIDEWLNNLKIQIPQEQGKELIRSIINDLVEEIVQRHKYLALNPNHNVSDEADLEFFKYQVFKLINKLTVQDNLKVVQGAPDLMNRIKNIPVPILSKLQYNHNLANQVEQSAILSVFSRDRNVPITINYNTDQNSSLYCNNIRCESEINQKYEFDRSYEPSYKIEDNDQIINIALSNIAQKANNCKPQCSSDLKNTTVSEQNEVLSSTVETNVDVKNNDQLEAEYDQFIKDWVQEIPVTATNVDEMAILEKARLGIYNGLWKVISKLNCDPSTYYNQFLYEDLLDDAIDDLLDCLPQSPELKSKRHLLKVKLIEKTISTNNKIKENEEASFKNKLIQNVEANLRKQGITEHRDSGNPTKLHEDMQITKLVENYLLLTKFKNEDKVISNVYRKKLLKEIEEFVQDLVKNHAMELKDIDIASYESNIMNLLNKVPLPSENTIKQEADDVLLGMEIEQWYSDLPIVSNNDYTEQYQRRKQRDILVKKIKEIESKNEMDSTDFALRNEVSKFLEKAPLEQGESLNINFMVDELLNRLKNKTKYDNSQNSKRIEFQIPDRYDAFSKNMSCCSSYTKLPRPTKVVIHEPPSYRVFDEERPLSSSFKETTEQNEQWLTLQKTLPDVGTQTNKKKMHTLTPFDDSITHRKLETPNETGREPIDKKYSIDIEPERNSEYFQQQQFLPHDVQTVKRDDTACGKDREAGSSFNDDNNENMYMKNNPTSQNFKGTSVYSQRNNDIPNPTDLSRRELKNQMSNSEGDPYLLKCSKLCQTANANVSQLETEPNTKALIDKSTDNKTNFESIYRHATKNEYVTNNRRVPSQEKDTVRRKLTYDSDEADVIPCNCIERYLKHRQKIQKYSCDEFDRLPSCLPIFYPYPYFIL